mgnify:FL=1
MNVLIFEYKNIGIEDVCEALRNLGHSYKCITHAAISDSFNKEFDELFDKEIESVKYDCVFTFNYLPIISNCCNRHHIPYISHVYDSPLVALYSYTIINPCNYVFLFDKSVYLDFKKENINTVYYMPLAVNVSRLDSMMTTITPEEKKFYSSEVSFVGSMYNEKHNFFERMKDISAYTKGYLDGIMQAQMKVYGEYFIQQLLKPDILNDMKKALPLETEDWLFAYYVIARKMANLERTSILKQVSKNFKTKLFTRNQTPELPDIQNMGPVDYYNMMPCVFHLSEINLNISLRSIRTGIPLRCLDIMGAGGLLLSNYQSDFYEHFIPGQDLVLYESVDDLLKKCAYYLRHESERKQIAINGYNKVKEYHTYEVRLQQMFDIVFNQGVPQL